jgi:dienelactone hydrolase
MIGPRTSRLRVGSGASGPEVRRQSDRSRRARGRAATVVAVLVAVTAASTVTVTGCSGGADRGDGAPTPPASGAAPGSMAAAPPATPATSGSTLTSAAIAPATAGTGAGTTVASHDRSWAVAQTTRTFTDASRSRTLRVTIYYPAAAPSPADRPAGTEPVGAAADATPATGPFPLVVMAHGYLLPGDGYDRINTTVASRGYVVAAPEFPHTTAHGGDGQRGDIVNQPRDLTFVADQVVAEGGQEPHMLPAIDDPSRIAVIGHSDGGLTATAFGYGQQFRDPRVAAVVSMTGGVALFPGPFFTTDAPPLLAVHARDDTTNLYRASVDLFQSVPAGRPRFLLSIDRGSHIDPYMFGSGRIDVGDAVAAFLDLTIRHDGGATDRLRAISTSPGLSLEEQP